MSQVAQLGADKLPVPEHPLDERDIARTPWQLFWERFKQDKAALVGLGFLVVLVIMAVGAGVISDALVHHGPRDLFQKEMTDEFGLPKGPNAQFWFGADTSGRDLFVRVMYGARVSLTVALLATGIALLIGVTLGVIAGYFGGKIDTVISRAIDIVFSIPLLVFAIGIVGACRTGGCGPIKPGFGLVVGVIALFSWPYIARIIRGNTLSIREKEFIEASEAAGASSPRIMFKEVLPNLMAPIVVYGSVTIPGNVLFESYLSYLGLGLPKSVPSWGGMMSDAADLFDVAWWMMVFPGLFLLFTVLAFNLLGYGLRDALDPRTGR